MHSFPDDHRWFNDFQTADLRVEWAPGAHSRGCTLCSIQGSLWNRLSRGRLLVETLYSNRGALATALRIADVSDRADAFTAIALA